jgi:hypothetical protein
MLLGDVAEEVVEVEAGAAVATAAVNRQTAAICLNVIVLDIL